MTSTTDSMPSRRGFLGGSAKTLSSAGLVAMMGSGAALGFQSSGNPEQDVQLLNAAIALEHEGIAAYTIAAGSGLLAPEVVNIGVIFRGHHREHRDELIRAVETLGGMPVAAESDAHYAEALNAGSLQNQADVLRLAYGLEVGAANAYLGLIPSLSTTEQHQLAARMAGDEAFHAAILGNAIGEAIPTAGLMFG
ncbi:ferritin-like domain-containing protein [Hyphobacterium marinum]|uniref:Ferritin-like domain-containing protein n=1 Tax=Hyphobacterium marinum TaxID=3116574 RepID=A0ABU7M106_9PROT|nr:ferritin-like domain-containing protein [Hyphobacterium sp. Y6023]MEE2567471.1 ferritin-like domain-containing protein [Hyphobacterium sp. Y6023]